MRLHFDYNASTPLAPEVAAVMRRVMEEPFGNPSSTNWAGAPARAMIDAARRQVADLLGCSPDEIVFTSGGSEANNLALKGAFFSSRRDHPHIVTTRIEHPAILSPCTFLERLGATVTYLPVDSAGRMDPDDLRRAVRPETILVSVMHANNEVGTIEPIEECADVLIYLLLVCERAGIDLAAAARAKIELNASRYPVETSRGNARKYTEL